MGKRSGAYLKVAAIVLLGTASPAVPRADEPVLRVCAPASSLPFSNRAGQGYENKIAALVAHVAGMRLTYAWTKRAPTELLNGNTCDAVVAVPVQFPGVDTTRPYYTSSYVAVTRRDRALAIDSMKDAKLKMLKIGIEALDGGRVEDAAARALTDRGLAANIVRFPVRSDGRDRSRLFEALAKGDIDTAVVWGPVAGYFARRASVPLTLTPITDTDEFSSRKSHLAMVAFQYDIAIGVRKGDEALRTKLDQAIASEAPAIRAILREYGVPLVDARQIAGRPQGEAGP